MTSSGALADEGDHQDGLGTVGDHAVGDLLEHGGLARLGRRDDEAALSQADGSEEVHHAGGKLVGRSLQHHLPLGEDRGQVLEGGTVAAVNPAGGVGGVEAVDLLDADEAEVALAFLGRTDLSGDGVAGAEAEAPDLGLGDVYVAGVAVRGDLAEEAVAFVHDLQDAGGDQGLVGGGDLEHTAEDVLAVHLVQRRGVAEADAGGQAQQFFLGLAAQLHHVQSLAGYRHVYLIFLQHRGHRGHRDFLCFSPLSL